MAQNGGGARLSRAERRRQVLTHAKQLFATLGYDAVSIEQIASAAGVAEAVLRKHFQTKLAVFEELVQEIREATLSRWQTGTAELADPLAKLHAVADLYLDCIRDHTVELRILHRALVECADQEVLSLLRSFYVASESFLAQIIAEGQQSGVFRRSLDPRVGAWELIRAGLGYTLTLPLDLPLYQEADYVARAMECLLHCLLKTDV